MLLVYGIAKIKGYRPRNFDPGRRCISYLSGRRLCPQAFSDHEALKTWLFG